MLRVLQGRERLASKREVRRCLELTTAYEQRFVLTRIVRQFLRKLDTAGRDAEIHRVSFGLQSWFRWFAAALHKDSLTFVGQRKIDEELGRVGMWRFLDHADRMQRYDCRLQSDPIDRRSLFFHQIRAVPVGNDLQIVFVSWISEVIDAALEVLVANPPPPVIISDAGRSGARNEIEPISVKQG